MMKIIWIPSGPVSPKAAAVAFALLNPPMNRVRLVPGRRRLDEAAGRCALGPTVENDERHSTRRQRRGDGLCEEGAPGGPDPSGRPGHVGEMGAQFPDGCETQGTICRAPA